MIERPSPVLSSQFADLTELAGDAFRRECASS